MLFLESASSSSSTLPWWQVASGVIGIPTALLGLIYTYRLSQKTRLESRKLQLEIIEKERLALSPDSTTEVSDEVRATTQVRLSTTRTQDFTVRFIICWLATQGWSFVTTFLTPFLNAVSIAVYQYFQKHGVDTQKWSFVLAFSVLAGILNFGDTVIFLVLGLPLLLGIATSLGIKHKLLVFGRSGGA